ncbi:MAG: M20 family metallo-hydrolase [Pusillimonas sp.]
MKASNKVDHQRVNWRLDEMAKIGAIPNDGVNRQALSKEDAAAQNLLIEWGAEMGLTPSIDDIGNLFLRLEGQDSSLDPVMTGSHMDSQPTGGRYDGIYGVIASLEALQAIVSAGIRPARSIELVSWVNEEGSRFAPSLMGSGVHVGARSLEEALALHDVNGVTVAEAIEALQPELSHIPRRPIGVKAASYLEAHIEQGPILECNGETIGVVTGIQGKHTYRITVTGEAAHAGTAPHSERKDALIAAARIVLALGQEFEDAEDITRFTVGRFIVAPNAPSVVPREVVFSIDLRHPDGKRLIQMSSAVQSVCDKHAGPCKVEVVRLYEAAPIVFDERIQQAIEKVAIHLSMPYRYMLSAAGHDAGLMQQMCPTGMVFIPSKDGITHNEAEYSYPADITAGARVMADALVILAG